MQGRRTLREWRALRKLDKQDMANVIGVHPSTYSKWEDRPEEIRIREAARIADALDCNVKDIIFFEANPNFKLDFNQS